MVLQKKINTKNVENWILNNFKNGNFCLKLIFKRQDIKEFFGKCPDFRKNVSICRPYLFFKYVFFSIFFSIPITSTNFLGLLSGHFFDFLPYMAGKSTFSPLKSPKKCHFQAKVKEFLTEILLCGWNSRTWNSNFFDFLMGGNDFWGKVPITKVVHNDPFYRSFIKFLQKIF